MRHVERSALGLVLRRPLMAGLLFTALAVGLGMALAMPGITWRGAASAEEASLAVERAFAMDGPGTAPGPVPDIALTDQEGRRVRLRQEAGRVVLVNFVTTRCSTTCAQVTRELRGLQQALGDRMGRDVVFLSVGIDPVRDTPASLRRFARRHGADFTGWAFLSGTAEELETARRAFGVLAISVPKGRGHTEGDFEHTTWTYVVDRQGVIRKKIAPGLLTLAGLREVEIVLASAR